MLCSRFLTATKEATKSHYNAHSLVSPQLIERYAMASARWIQCESITSELGFLAKHPTTGAAIQSPYVAIADKYMTQANRLWSEIYQIVRENCTGEYSGASPQDDVMERLLRAMTTALFLLRCTEIGISIADLDLLTIGLVMDMWTEKGNDGVTYDKVASQEDFDRF